jgi:hypothetical protein
MKITCPKCQQPVDVGDINVGANVAVCRRCNEAFALGDLIATGEVDDGPLGEPPPGCWFNSGVQDWEVGASMRSYAGWFLVPFMLVWSGFSIGGIYGMQVVEGKFNPLLSLFGIPFVLGTIVLGSVAVMTVCGKTTLRVDNDRAETFVGAGSIGWRRRFLWSEITQVEERLSRFTANKNTSAASYEIWLEGGSKLIKFGFGVKDERRMFLLRVLRRMLVTPRH